jgi:hypothetical protein
LSYATTGFWTSKEKSALAKIAEEEPQCVLQKTTIEGEGEKSNPYDLIRFWKTPGFASESTESLAL